MQPNITEVVGRIRALREDLDITRDDMAKAVGLSAEEYAAVESAPSDLSFTFLYRCAERLGVDIVELLTGESPHLTGYSVVRAGHGLPIKRREGFEYLHLAPTFKGKLAEPFFVTAPVDGNAEGPVQMSRHTGQEFNFVVSGQLRFCFEDHVEDLEAGDAVFYDSGRRHGMVAIGSEPCTFLAIVLKDADAESR